MHPLLYNLLYDLGGDLELTRRKIDEVRQKDHQILLVAAEIAGRALVEFPNHLFLCYVNGILALANHRPLAGVALLKRVIDLARKSEDHAAALATLDVLDGVFKTDLFLVERRAEVLVGLERSSEAMALLEGVGDRLSAQGSVELAIQCWWRACQIDQGQYALLHKVADGVARIALPTSGLDVVKRLLAQANDAPPLVAARAILLSRHEAKDQSATEFERAERLAHDHLEHLVFVHRAAMRHATLDVARRCSQRLSELDPDGSRRRTIIAHVSEAPGAASLGDRGFSPARAPEPDAGSPAETATATPGSRRGEAVGGAAGRGSEEPAARTRDALRLSVTGTVVRLVVWGLAVAFLGLLATPLYQMIQDDRRDTQLARDFMTLKLALRALELKKQPHLESSLVPLVRARVLAEDPLDPWGGFYVFDWVNQRIISAGANGVLDTLVPDLPPPAGDAGSGDDIVQSLWDTPDWFVAPGLADEQALLRNFVLGAPTGSDPTHKLSGRVLAVHASPDRRMLLVSTATGTVGAVMLLDRSRNSLTALRLPLDHVVGAEWAGPTPDELVVEGTQPGSRSAHGLYLAKTDGSRCTPLTQDLSDAREPTVDPMNRTVYFIGSTERRRSLFMMSLLDRKLHALEIDADRLRAPAIAPGGRHLAYVVADKNQQETLEVVDVRHRERVLRWPGILAGSYPVWSWDGGRLAAVAAEPKGRLCIGHARKKAMHASTLGGIAGVRFCWMTASRAIRRDRPAQGSMAPTTGAVENQTSSAAGTFAPPAPETSSGADPHASTSPPTAAPTDGGSR